MRSTHPKLKHSCFCFIVLLLFVSPTLLAQKLRVRSYNVGFRIFELDAFGNNPTTLAPLLKNPQPYQEYINNFDWNSLHGNPGIHVFKNFYLSAEFHKLSPESRFWKKHTLQAGLFISTKGEKGHMGIGNEGWHWEDTTRYSYHYKPIQELQFAGAHLGVNRRHRLSKKLYFVYGLHVQGSVAVHHIFKQNWDSSTFHLPSDRRTSFTHKGKDLKGKHYLQWQAMVPFGLEVNIYRQRLFVRAEAIFGYIGGRFQKLYGSTWEGHGVGLWFGYRLQQ
jgi:hypothetical protein